jgi:hypothetical protein
MLHVHIWWSVNFRRLPRSFAYFVNETPLLLQAAHRANVRARTFARSAGCLPHDA